MKTYRCPWCVSRTNHNILYFVHISRTSSLNTAICLWKLRFSLAQQGFQRSEFASNPRQCAGRSRTSISSTNPSPRRTPAQGAEPVHFARGSVQVVDIWVGNSTRYCRSQHFILACQSGRHFRVLLPHL